MVKPKMTIEKMLQKEPYRSVINLMQIEYERHKQRYRDSGFQQKHLRYALIKDHDFRNFDRSTFDEIQRFFKMRLQPMEATGKIKVGCITSKEHLNVVLKRMLSLGIITIDRRFKIRRYKVNKDIKGMGEKIRSVEQLNSYHEKYVFPFNYDDYSLIFYGISKDVWHSLKENERDLIRGHINNIKDSLKKIDEIRISKTIGYIANHIYHLNEKKFFPEPLGDTIFREFLSVMSARRDFKNEDIDKLFESSQYYKDTSLEILYKILRSVKISCSIIPNISDNPFKDIIQSYNDNLK